MNKNLNIYNNIVRDNNINITSLNELNNNILLKKYENLVDNEPNRLFNKKHKKWEEEIEKVKKELNKSFDTLSENYKSIEKTM